MPIYEYVCQKCEQPFELLIRGDEQPACPQCGNRRLQRQLSVPAAHSAGGSSLPMSAPDPGGCGLPQCGGGRCAGWE